MPIMLVGALVMMVVTSPKLSGLVLVAIPADRAAAGGLRPRRAAPVARRRRTRLADASAYAAENLAAVRTMQAFTHEAAVSASVRRRRRARVRGGPRPACGRAPG